MDQHIHAADETLTYRVEIASEFHEKWTHWLNGKLLKIENCCSHSVLFLSVPDQAALRGTLNMLWDLNLPIISIKQLTVGNE